MDAVGFLKTGGYFVSFMSGNTTQSAVGLARGSLPALVGLALIVAFVMGVSAGASVGRLLPRYRTSAILGFVALLLAGASIALSDGRERAAVALLAAAMGAENTVFAEAGEVRFGVTYMTGALVKVGKGLTVAAFGGDRFAWAPHLMLWLSLAAGAALGAAAFARFGVLALWAAATIVAMLALIAPPISRTEV